MLLLPQALGRLLAFGVHKRRLPQRSKTYAAALTASDFRQIDTRFTGNQLHRDAEGRIVAQQQGEVFTLTDEASTATRIALPTEAQYAETDGQGGWWIGFSDNGFVRRPADAVDWTIEKPRSALENSDHATT